MTEREEAVAALRLACAGLQAGMPREQTLRRWLSAMGLAVIALLEEKEATVPATPKTPEQQARELLNRMGIVGALEMSTGDVVEIANLIAERCRLDKENYALRARLAGEHGYTQDDIAYVVAHP